MQRAAITMPIAMDATIMDRICRLRQLRGKLKAQNRLCFIHLRRLEDAANTAALRQDLLLLALL